MWNGHGGEKSRQSTRSVRVVGLRHPTFLFSFWLMVGVWGQIGNFLNGNIGSTSVKASMKRRLVVFSGLPGGVEEEYVECV